MRFVVIGLVLSILVLVPQFAVANTAPVADPNGPYEGTTGQLILFDGSASSDADGDLLTYAWDFGDGGTGIGIAPLYAYAVPGVYAVTLVVNDSTEDSTPSLSAATISIQSPSCLQPEDCSPENGASSIALPLEFGWPAVPLAQSYFYNISGMNEAFLAGEERSGPLPESILEFLSPERYDVYKEQCEQEKGARCSDEEIQQVIVQRQTYYWGVKSCTIPTPSSPEDASCGPWSDPSWSFTYIPQPPEELVQPAPESSNVSLPVTLRWLENENAKSYLLDVRVDIGCTPWERFVGFFLGGECDPFNFILEPLERALHDWLGAGEGYDPSCPWSLWDSETEECSTLSVVPASCPQQQWDSEAGVCLTFPELPPPGENVLIPAYFDDGCVFSKNAPYLVTVATCLDEGAQICGEWSDRWGFSTGDTNETGAPYTLSAPELMEPKYDPTKNIPAVGKTHRLSWKGGLCGGYVRLIIEAPGRPSIETTIPNFDIVLLSESGVGELWNEPGDLDKEYTWSLEPCWRIKDDIQCEAGVRSEEWHFKTIGAPPSLGSPGNGELVKIPSILKWQHTEGVGSYLVQTAGDENFTQELAEGKTTDSSFVLSIDDFEPDKQYWWRVASCADEEGNVCGEWNPPWSFRTHPLNAPAALVNPPEGEGTAFPGTISWEPDPGANYYQYQINYDSLVYGALGETETRPACIQKEGSIVSQGPGEEPPITSQPGLFFQEYCRGEYTLLVRSCLDKECSTANPANLNDAAPWMFFAIKQTTQEPSGLVPCGKTVDHVNTPFDETEPCQLKHAGFLLQNLLDFVLWRVSLFILAILAVLVGATTYFSFGRPDVIQRAKQVFRSFLYGFLLMVFAWFIVNLVMVLFGFNAAFFGRWWEISF